VIAIYSFCCRNYQPGDHIYCFGFSRGAFTIRIVAGMIALHGLVRYDDNEADLARFAADVYRLYRRRFTGGILKYLGYFGIDLRGVRDLAIYRWRELWQQPMTARAHSEVDSIHFVGLWDTVDAYGGPIEEMTRAIDYWVWPLSMPDRFMGAKVHKACHALALEDEREAFRPVIWDERYVRGIAQVAGQTKTEWLFDIDYHAPSRTGAPLEVPPHLRTDLAPIDRKRISQVWFTGVHSDIGGGYPQDGLSYLTLDWMLDRAQAYGLKYLDAQRRLLIDPQINPDDKLNDSRRGLAGYYRYKPRNILETYGSPPYKPSIRYDLGHIWRLLRTTKNNKPVDPQSEIHADLHPSMPATVLPAPEATVHDSVFKRINSGTDRYAPVVMPATYIVTDKAGTLTGKRHPVDPGRDRSRVQDDAWNWLWFRRIVYFLTVFSTLFIAAIPLMVIYFPDTGQDSVGAFVVPIVDAAASFLPGVLKPWFDAFRNAPGLTLTGVVAVAGLMFLGSVLRQTIRDVMRTAWHSPAGYHELTGWHYAVYRLRRLGIYRATFYILRHWVFPTAIFFWLFLWLAFGAVNTLGLICKGTGRIDVRETETAAVKSAGYGEEFSTSDICYPTGLKVARGERYQIRLVVTAPWFDSTIPADPRGFEESSWAQLWGVLYKRLIWSNWFAPIVRVGGPGLEEHLPDFKDEGNGNWTASFTPRSDGEVFVYVNDTSIFLPWLFHAFYDNNQGKAVVSLKKM
jgi:hypothetical protein